MLLSQILIYFQDIVLLSCPFPGRRFCCIDDTVLAPECSQDLRTHVRNRRVDLKEQAWEIDLQRIQRLGRAVAFTGEV